jgi:hypothetical protein
MDFFRFLKVYEKGEVGAIIVTAPVDMDYIRS